jgi:signal transduction histidine kinase
MREGVRGLYDEVRLTIQDLRWLPEDGQGLLERLNQYVLQFKDRTGLDISLALEGEPSLAPQDEVHLFRIVQEALANVHKHAQARRAWVRLETGPEGTTLEVEDDGKGMLPEIYHDGGVSSPVAGHYGLRIMQERAEAMGGQLSWKSIPGQGTRLLVSVGTGSGRVRPDRSLESVGPA